MKPKVLTVVNIKITVVWDMVPCSLVNRYLRFGGTFFFLVPWRWRQEVYPKHIYVHLSTRLHGVTSKIYYNINTRTLVHYCFLYIRVYFRKWGTKSLSRNTCCMFKASVHPLPLRIRARISLDHVGFGVDRSDPLWLIHRFYLFFSTHHCRHRKNRSWKE